MARQKVFNSRLRCRISKTILDVARRAAKVRKITLSEFIRIAIGEKIIRDISDALAKKELELLTKESNKLLKKMQTAKARRGMKTAFNATPEELGRAAVKQARKARKKNRKRNKERAEPTKRTAKVPPWDDHAPGQDSGDDSTFR